MIADSLNIPHSLSAVDGSQVEDQDRKDHSMLEISEMHLHCNAAAKWNILHHI